MRATIKQALYNDRNLSVERTGYGHWKIECDYRGKRLSTITTNSSAVDDFNSEEYEIKDGRNRILCGYTDLIETIIRDNKN